MNRVFDAACKLFGGTASFHMTEEPSTPFSIHMHLNRAHQQGHHSAGWLESTGSCNLSLVSCITKGSSTGMLLGVACASATFVSATSREHALTAELAVPSSCGAHSRCCLDAKMTLLTSPSASS